MITSLPSIGYRVVTTTLLPQDTPDPRASTSLIMYPTTGPHVLMILSHPKEFITFTINILSYNCATGISFSYPHTCSIYWTHLILIPFRNWTKSVIIVYLLLFTYHSQLTQLLSNNNICIHIIAKYNTHGQELLSTNAWSWPILSFPFSFLVLYYSLLPLRYAITIIILPNFIFILMAL